jgi:hypothetical protein
MKRFTVLICGDFVLLVLAYGLTHLLKYGNLNIYEPHDDLFKYLIIIWLAVSLAARKYSRLPQLSLLMGAGLLLKTGIAILFFLSLFIVSVQMMNVSRTMAFGTIIVLLVLELTALTAYQWIKGPVPHPGRLPVKYVSAGISLYLIIMDIVLLVGAFFLVTHFKRGSFALDYPYDCILPILLGFWLASSLLVRKFNRDNFVDFFSAMAVSLKSAIFMAAGLTFVIYLFRLEPVSRLQTLGPIALFLVLESIVFMLYINFRRYGQPDGDIEDGVQVRSLLDTRDKRSLPETAQVQRVVEPAQDKLRHALEFFDPGIYEFIDSHVDLKKLDRSDCALLSTDNMLNLDILDQDRMGLIINLHKMNDMRWPNRYLLLGHGKIRSSGFLVGTADTTSTHRDYIRSRYPVFTSNILYGLTFIWGRMFPRLPWLKTLYFTVTKGKGRMFSRAEILGRLIFCGYEIVAEKEMGYKFYFIARKIKKPSMEENPTFGPLVKLVRSGFEGKPITVYKFRTMYPFSECLQEYVYNNSRLEHGGKFKDDFRVTGWGKFMRRVWLDELPMLFNWMRGDLRLVGVRPLSSQYLELYTPELRKFRQKVKPGLLPPFYADMPTTLEEIMDSERRYIESYLRYPIRTQVRYFIKCVYNIVVRKKRSA